MAIAQSWCRCAMGEPSPGGRQRLRPEPFRQISLHTCSTNPLAARRAEPLPPAHTHESIPGRASIATNALQSRRAESGTRCTAQIMQHAARNGCEDVHHVGRPPIRTKNSETSRNLCREGRTLESRRLPRRLLSIRHWCRDTQAAAQPGTPTNTNSAIYCFHLHCRSRAILQMGHLAPIVHAQNERSLAVMATVVHVLHESFHGMSSNGAQSSRPEGAAAARACSVCVCVHLRSARVPARGAEIGIQWAYIHGTLWLRRQRQNVRTRAYHTSEFLHDRPLHNPARSPTARARACMHA